MKNTLLRKIPMTCIRHLFCYEMQNNYFWYKFIYFNPFISWSCRFKKKKSSNFWIQWLPGWFQDPQSPIWIASSRSPPAPPPQGSRISMMVRRCVLCLGGGKRYNKKCEVRIRYIGAWSVQAAVTKYHRLQGLNKSFISCSPGGWKSKTRCQHGQVLDSFPGCFPQWLYQFTFSTASLEPHSEWSHHPAWWLLVCIPSTWAGRKSSHE